MGPVVHQLHDARQPAGYVHPHRDECWPGNLRGAPEGDFAPNRALTRSRLIPFHEKPLRRAFADRHRPPEAPAIGSACS